MELEVIKAVVLGHAVGDALGVPVEFMSREELAAEPVTQMIGWGTYPLPRGCWSDDTSMALATLDSLGAGIIDYNDIMDRFAAWCVNDEYTPTGEMFDIGGTCLDAIMRYLKDDNICATDCGGSDELSNGNGALMRIHPAALMLCEMEDRGAATEIIHKISALTHAHDRSKIACGIYAFILRELICGGHKDGRAAVRRGLSLSREYYADSPEFRHYSDRLCQRIAAESADEMLSREEIKSSGYVVDTLEAAVWCLLTTSSYAECVLMAVNLGEDTDTVAAIAGGLAGAMYGLDAIPGEWLEGLKRREYIEELCERAHRAWGSEVIKTQNS